ncbi:HD domain-containing phosphohydrolase, partial [Hungatella sp. SL.1.14]|uniref:HD-GYP domain-containing protein n=1 Tax=Hungatella sp. SL.1.14 TaxID=2963703 RepID=UPI00210BAA55
EILSNIVEFRNGESGLHVLHIRVITEMLLKKLVEKTDRIQLSLSDIALIVNASALHNIGKISIPEEILNKPGRLTPEEFEIMKTHAAIGAQILKNA